MNPAFEAAPHIHSDAHTRGVMLDVCIALSPALATGIVRFGLRALLLTAACIAAAMAAEWLCCAALHRPCTLQDGSAALSGLLLAMILPFDFPIGQALIGAFFAICIVKWGCGGLGRNIFNPALCARALLMLLFPASLVRFHAPDGMSGATPLHRMAMGLPPEQGLWAVFLGKRGGCIGEICAPALLLGGAYLLVRRVISIRIPAAYLGMMAALGLIFARTGNPIQETLYGLFSGGAMLGSIFMATDYATSPVTPKGQLLYGMGCGALTIFFRRSGLYPEGVSYAILMMNACAWALDRRSTPRRFGASKGGAI